MNKVLKKMFGGIQLTWPKLILAAVIAGVYTAVMAIIPALHDTSFHTIVVTFEVWILFGILIIMNSRSNLDSALKCFVFFLISQPLVYLLQVPFSPLGWQLFRYYKTWFIWTILCLPMGYIGYYMKKDRWWGLLILLPMIALTAYSFATYFSLFLFSRPQYLLISIFCAAVMILYPIAIFHNPKIQIRGAVIGGAAVIALAAVCLRNPYVYSTDIMGATEELPFDDAWTVSLADDSYGDVSIVYSEGLEEYMLHADFKRDGDTVMTFVSPEGEEKAYDLHIEEDYYDMQKR